MDNTKDDVYYIQKVVENIDTIISYSKGINLDEFINDSKLIDAIIFRFSTIWINLIKTCPTNVKAVITTGLGSWCSQIPANTPKTNPIIKLITKEINNDFSVFNK